MKFLYRATCGCAITMAVGLMTADVASAQSPQPPPTTTGSRYEVGGQLSGLRASDLNATNPGFGGRFAYEFTDWLSAEAEYNFFPHEDYSFSAGQTPITDLHVTTMRHRGEAFFGPKI